MPDSAQARHVEQSESRTVVARGWELWGEERGVGA